jgi:hypothetical protein
MIYLQLAINTLGSVGSGSDLKVPYKDNKEILLDRISNIFPSKLRHHFFPFSLRICGAEK